MWWWSDGKQQTVFDRKGLCAHFPARSKGLTLIELVVVMTLLVLLAFIAAPSFVNTTKSAQVRTAAQQIVALLRYARAKALSLGRPVLVSFDREQNMVGVLLPSDVVESNLTASSQSPTPIPQLELTDEDWRKLSGERLEVLDPEQFVPDPSPMGRERKLPEGVQVESIQDIDTGEELNLLAFYPDGTASGAEIVVSNDRLAVLLQISPLTGSIHLQELTAEEVSRRQR